MNKLLLLSLCVFQFITVSGSAWAQHISAEGRSNELLRFVAKSQGLRQFGLYLVMEERCYKYLPEKEAEFCGTSSKKTLNKLDFDIILNENKTPFLFDEIDPESFVFVAFKQEFLKLLGESKTVDFLKLVNEKLNRFMSGQDQTPANLWDESVTFYGSNELAARALAILFQDTSPQKLHLRWIEKKNVRGSVTFTENQHLLERIIDTINFIMDTSDSHYRELFYPRSLQKMINRNIYHFYVPLYLSSAVQSAGMKKEHAYMGPLMMTLSYEFITAAKDLRYLFSDPAKVSDQSLLDIFAGHAGGRFGVDLPFKTFDDLRTAFTVSTPQGVSLLLK